MNDTLNWGNRAIGGPWKSWSESDDTKATDWRRPLSQEALVNVLTRGGSENECCALIVVQYPTNLAFPVFPNVLDDAQGINPDIAQAAGAHDTQGVCESGRKCFEGDITPKFSKVVLSQKRKPGDGSSPDERQVRVRNPVFTLGFHYAHVVEGGPDSDIDQPCGSGWESTVSAGPVGRCTIADPVPDERKCSLRGRLRLDRPACQPREMSCGGAAASCKVLSVSKTQKRRWKTC